MKQDIEDQALVGGLNQDQIDQCDNFGYYTGGDFIELGMRLGLPKLAAKHEVDLFIARQDLAFALINHSFLPENMKISLAGVFAERINALKHS